MSRAVDEVMAVKISDVLNGLCPAFKRVNTGGCEWHRCSCTAVGGACTCVWRVTDTCKAGKWSQLSFAAKYRAKKRSAQNKSLNKVRQIITKGGVAAALPPETEEVPREALIDLEE